MNRCTSKALDVNKHARCVAKVVSLTKDRKREFWSFQKQTKESFLEKPKDERNLTKYSKKLKAKSPKRFKFQDKTTESNIRRSPNIRKLRKSNKTIDWIGPFSVSRAKRAIRLYKVIQRDSYTLKTKHDHESPFAEVGRRLTKSIRLLKNKTQDETWEQTMGKLERKAKEVRLHEKYRKTIGNKFRMYDANSIFDDEDTLGSNEDLLPNLNDVANGKDKKMLNNVMNFARDGVKLGMMLTNQNTSDFDHKNVRINSPRFLSITPEENPDDTVNVFSPSLLSLHTKGKGVESLLSMPKIMKDFHEAERNSWMNFIVEASGVADAIPKIEAAEEMSEQHRQRRYRDDSGRPLYVTKENVTNWVGDEEARKLDTHARLRRSYSMKQIKEMNTTGYTTLTDDQLHILYGPDSPFNNTEALQRFSNMSRADVEHLIENDIKMTAEMENFSVRQNDIIGSPFFFAKVHGPAGSAVSHLILISNKAHLDLISKYHFESCGAIDSHRIAFSAG
ncbi:hypothetical protein L596_026763 [Steinernema carpocapsae]|uniref:Uncharacterized protein n=1 Tax=Steinernema carpocapsae TaxID=34508 RepID=A0A4U5M2C1_STECR|nr:hypothetical protein L596_026763 [Steinernema carpocapsae]